MMIDFTAETVVIGLRWAVAALVWAASIWLAWMIGNSQGLRDGYRKGADHVRRLNAAREFQELKMRARDDDG